MQASTVKKLALCRREIASYMSTGTLDSRSWEKIILGTAGLGGVWKSVDPDLSVATILHALKEGIGAIDTAPAYGDAELFVGQAIRHWKGKPPFISTKVGRLKTYTSDQGRYDYSPSALINSAENSLQQLGISQVDLLFLHEPAAIPPPQIKAAVEQMLVFKETGITKKIGLGGNYPSLFKNYLEAGIFDVVMEYNRLNACCTDAIGSSLAACTDNGISYWAASPLYMGLLGRRFQEFTQSPPNWLDRAAIVTALRLEKIAHTHQLPLSTLAIRFMQTIAFPINIVLGASNQQELDQTLVALKMGPLPAALFQEVLECINEKKYNKI